MTEQEARRMLAEHWLLPQFVRGRHLYSVRRDGRVDVFRMTATRAIFDCTLAGDSYALPPDVRERLSA